MIFGLLGSKWVWTSLIIISLLMFQLPASMFLESATITPFHPAYAKGSGVSVDLSAVPSELTTGNVVTITLICPPTSASPTTGNTAILAHASHDTAFTQVITPLEVQLVKANASNFEKAGYIWTWHKSDGITLSDGRIKFEAQYPVGAAGSKTYQWHPANTDFPVNDRFPGTNLEGQYQVIAQCLYGPGTPDGHALSAPIQQFVISKGLPPRIAITDLKIVNELGTVLSYISVGSKAMIRSTITNLQSEKQPFVYIVQIKDADEVTVSLSWLKDELPAKKLSETVQSWVPKEGGNYRIQVFIWDGLDNPLPLSPVIKKATICYS